MSMENDGGMILTGENQRTRRKTCPSATLSTTNPIWIDQGANPELLGQWPATEPPELRHGQRISEDSHRFNSIQLSLRFHGLMLVGTASPGSQCRFQSALPVC
jgi:hypothetical protein